MSKSVLQRQEDEKELARAEILRDAKIKYERKVEAEERARKRKERTGEATWMNPALSKRLDKKSKASDSVRCAANNRVSDLTPRVPVHIYILSVQSLDLVHSFQLVLHSSTVNCERLLIIPLRCKRFNHSRTCICFGPVRTCTCTCTRT